MAFLVSVCLSLFWFAVSASAAEEEWEFDGGGWGYGVGLSQYGARGQALDGRGHGQILAHYYVGTSIEQIPLDHWINSEPLPVGLVPNTTSVELGATGGTVTICQPADSCPPSHATFTDVTMDPGEYWRFEVNSNDNTQCRFRKTSPAPVGNLGWGGCDGRLLKPEETNVRFLVNSREYGRGEIGLTDSADGFHVVVNISFPEYLYGSDVIPSSWPTQALRAQAVMLRSDALVTAVRSAGGGVGVPNLESCGCYLVGDYVGWLKEDPSRGGAAWMSAVDSTEGAILRPPGLERRIQRRHPGVLAF